MDTLIIILERDIDGGGRVRAEISVDGKSLDAATRPAAILKGMVTKLELDIQKVTAPKEPAV